MHVGNLDQERWKHEWEAADESEKTPPDRAMQLNG